MSPPSQPPKRPATLDELVAAVRSAADAGEQIRITGSGSTDLTTFDAARPVRTLSTGRLNKVIEHAVGDMTVIVDAGISLEALQRHLAWRDQWLPVDPPVFGAARTPGQRTLGGLIASNSLGPLRFGCGDWRLFILGMRWIDAAGKVIKGGGRTMKNVAGYSTPRLMIGSCGSLGLIAEVTLRTFTRPADEQCVIFYCNNAAQAEALLAEIMLSPTTPAYVQVVGGRTFAANPLQLPTITGKSGAGVVVAVGYLGRTEICAAQLETLRALPTAAQVETISQTAAQSGRLRLWMTTEPALSGVPDDSAMRFRLHTRSSRVAALLESLEKEAFSPGGVWAVGEASGCIRGVVGGPAAAEVLKRTATAHDAHVLLMNPAPTDPSASPLARHLKHALDPANIFGIGPEM